MEQTPDAAHEMSSALEWPMPHDGVAVTQLLIVRDVARSRQFYTDVLGGHTLMEGPPSIIRFYNTWLIINEGGGPTDDKPDVIATAPGDSKTLTSALNLRVSDIQRFYEQWRAAGAVFLTPPKVHEFEIRCYMRDPDGYLIEVGQSTRMPGGQ